MTNRFAILLATWGGCGYFPKGQGTVASVVAIGMAYAVVWALDVSPLWFAAAAAAL